MIKTIPELELLIVDDDPTVRFLHKITLEMNGYPGILKEFPDGKPAMDYLNQKEAGSNKTLVLLDLNMPVMNGWRFLEFPLEVWENIAVVVVTSSCNRTDREKAFTYPQVVDYVEKPLQVEENFGEILKKVQDYFNGRTPST